MSLWKLRAVTTEDLPFILSSWPKSYRKHLPVQGVPDTVFYDKFHKLVSHLIENPTALIIIACDPEDDSTIFGYAVSEFDQAIVNPPLIFHWIYVKHSVRNFGIGRALEAKLKTIEHSGLINSTRSALASSEYVYDPFTLWKFIK